MSSANDSASRVDICEENVEVAEVGAVIGERRTGAPM
jgi:hypothetical protein